MRETPEELDHAVRMAAFAFLDERLLKSADVTLSFDVLRRGFAFRGHPVPLLAPQGIFKPAVLPKLPLTIRTTPPKYGKHAPYDDSVDSDDVLHYQYRGKDPMHRDNVGLREARAARAPLIYLRGITPGRYLPFWPVYVQGDDRRSLTFTVPLGSLQLLIESETAFRETAEPRRAYLTVPVRKRMHQASFRERVLDAYRECCAICRLRHRELLDATHILSDKHPQGEPVVSNGLSLCKLHHAAYDQCILGIRPDLRIDVRTDILEEVDGPMLDYGLKGFQGQRLIVPRRTQDRPNIDSLAERYEQFLRAS